MYSTYCFTVHGNEIYKIIFGIFERYIYWAYKKKTNIVVGVRGTDFDNVLYYIIIFSTISKI